MSRTKQQLRADIATRRKALDFQWLENVSARVIERFQALEEFQCSETVALYKAIGGEINLERLFSTCWKLGKRTCIPVFNTETRLYDMAEIAESTVFQTGNYGIQEPVAPVRIDFSEIGLIAVPGVGFDVHGNRLGRGGGYYDQMLNEFGGSCVGIALDFQIFPEIPAETHDQRVQSIVTETKYIKV